MTLTGFVNMNQAIPEKIYRMSGYMYAPIVDIMQMLTDPEDTRPIVLVEYLYQICNSGGGMN